jgi:hypothetical protein
MYQHGSADVWIFGSRKTRVPWSVVDELQHFDVRAWAACGSLE